MGGGEVERARERCHEATAGIENFPPMNENTMQRVVVVVVPPAPSQSGSNKANGSVLDDGARITNGPNFKAFRKNIVPRNKDAEERIPLQVFQARESQQQRQLEENQRELEEEQRRADELFREIGAVSSTTTRRRRR